MGKPSTQQRTWSDSDLAKAVKVATSWRSVKRQLGLNVTSASATRTLQRHAARLGLDTSHFRRKRSWSDAQLQRAVIEAHSWDDVLTALGLATENGPASVKSHAIRLGLNVSHLQPRVANTPQSAVMKPDLKHLREAGSAIAASWFTLCGCPVSLPVEPATYDLLAQTVGGISRVQVKTTTHKSGDGWHAYVSRRPYSGGPQARLVPYDPEDIDLFFIIDGDLAMYLIPSRVVAGRVVILLRTYTDYIVGHASGLMRSPAGRSLTVA
jgi:hypothetical protein